MSPGRSFATDDDLVGQLPESPANSNTPRLRRLWFAVFGCWPPVPRLVFATAAAGLLVGLFPGDRAHGDDTFPEIVNNESDTQAEPMAARQAAAEMQLPEGFSATVYASEPAVQNPIAMAWDQRGRMWIAENYTYSDRTQRFDLSMRDRVLILEDADGDGHAEKRKVFTDAVQMLTSVEVGHGGVWLMCPPQLLFLPDADGDDVADGPPQVVLDGFTVADSNYHNFANGLRWGPDGWLYGRCGHSCPGRIGLPGTPDDQRVPIEGGIWRYHPDRRTVEVLCHGTVNPWGHDWDADGELFFINTVIGHLWHLMPGAHFIESFGESSNAEVYERLDMIADHYHYDRSGSWQESRDGKANELGGGHAHIGMMIYQGNRWPDRYRGKLFTLNMHGLRANVERLERRGAGYVGKHEDDFLIAKDPFFRGIDIRTGPDGNAYVIDWSDTGECHDHTGVHRTSGRVYRIAYSDPEEATVGRPNGDSFAKPACLAGPGKLPRLWRDYQQGTTSESELVSLLKDPDEHVRVWAIRLLTDFWPLDTCEGPMEQVSYPEAPVINAALLEMARTDDSGLVQLTLASTLQRLPLERRSALAAELCRKQAFAGDHDLPLMVWFGVMPLVKEDPDALVDLARNCRWPELLQWLARGVATEVESSPEALDELLQLASGLSAAEQNRVLVGVSQAFRGWLKVPMPATWETFSKSDGAQQRAELVRELSLVFGDGRAIEELKTLVRSRSTDLKVRRSALETLIDARPADLRKICQSLLGERGLNATAARGLALWDDPEIGRTLAEMYRRFQPSDRPALIEILVSRPSFAAALLSRIDASKNPIPREDLTAFHARQILNLGDPQLRERLEQVWGAVRESPSDRREKIVQMQQRLSPEVLSDADLPNGRSLFKKTCSQCHRLFGDGEQIGPDLTGSQRSSLTYLLENILDPSAVVGKDHRMSIVMTNDGRVLSGLVVSSNDKTLVLQTQSKLETLPAGEIQEIKETTLSPMPDGLLTTLTDAQIRDLIGYLMQPTQVPLADPES
ncbi:c-type cytochrome [Roseiconus nitratireducens]|uniref:C-type cytochrome n=1 Tax=Roseiconus nitratireducens TaxID=2605748 RepID=A0A5M6DH56_9BACT|nr:PVC-type heme-binding CxxCH protein [Roseiconus nitratireducens]KAA5546887.1 c-type cytochrome [Roseiconus nitratireducens]